MWHGHALMQCQVHEFGFELVNCVLGHDRRVGVDGLIDLSREHGTCDRKCTTSGDEWILSWLKTETTRLQRRSNMVLYSHCGCGWDRGIAVGDEVLAEAYRSQWQRQCLLDLSMMKPDQFETPATNIHLNEAIHVRDVWVAAQSPTDVAGFFRATQYAYVKAGDFADEVDELDRVGGFAYGTGCDYLNDTRVEALGEVDEFADGVTAGLHRLLAQAGQRLTNARADTSLNRLGKNGLDSALCEAWFGDKKFDGIAANVDGGDDLVCVHVNSRKQAR